MSSDPLEDRLRRRGRERADEGLLSDAARAETLADVRALASREALRRRNRWVAVAAAALVLGFVGFWTRGGADWEPAGVEVALLDGRGRGLASRARSGDPDFVRPDALLVELVSATPVFAAAYFYDPTGARHRLGSVWPVPSDADFYFERELADLEVHAGESRVTVVVVSATARVERTTLEAALPARFEDLAGDARSAAEAALAADLERELGCAVEVASFVLAVR